MFAFIIIIRVLFVTCMVFIIGYIFGGFSKKPVLKTISRIAAILAIVLFIALNGFAMRMAFHNREHNHYGNWHRCKADSSFRDHR